MKVVCLVKQVPRADAIEFNPETHSLKREGVPVLLNAFDAAKLEHAVVAAQRVRGADVTVERHPDAAGIDEERTVRAGAPELQVAVAEHNSGVAHAGEHPFVVLVGLGRKALHVGTR